MIPHAGSLVLQRRLRIADAIRREGSVRVDTLSERLGVSAVTIRGDLAYLEAQGMVLRGAGHARALPGPLPRMPPDGNDAASSRPPPPALLRAARALVPDGGTVLLGPGPAALRLLPLLADVANLTLLLIALDAVPVARACTNAALHLVGGALDANGVLGGPQALASLLLHPVSLFVVEADGIRNDAATLHGLSPGHGEAFATGAAERAARTAVLLTGRGTGPAASAPSLPLFLVSDLLPANAPDANTEAALQRAGLERDGGTSRFRASGRRGREHGRSAA